MLFRSFIVDFCKSNNLKYHVDYKRNIYVEKGKVGENQHFPCVISHTDTVHTDQGILIDKNIRLDIVDLYLDHFDDPILKAYNPTTGRKTGIGGDDKCGVFVCLKLLEELDDIKAAFFVEEEIGMQGSKNLDISFFDNVGYALQPDAPTNNWFSKSCMGHDLWSDHFFESVKNTLEQYNIDNISRDPFTDVVQLVKKFDFCCAVLPAGYYNQHCSDEYVSEKDTNKCVDLAKDLIKVLGKRKFHKIP